MFIAGKKSKHSTVRPLSSTTMINEGNKRGHIEICCISISLEKDANFGTSRVKISPNY